jgi:hypothetical protein
MLAVPVTWVREAARRKVIPAIKLGRYWRFDPIVCQDLAPVTDARSLRCMGARMERGAYSEVSLQRQGEPPGHRSR